MKKQMIGLLAAVIAISAALVGCSSNNGQSLTILFSRIKCCLPLFPESMKMRINQLDINWICRQKGKKSL